MLALLKKLVFAVAILLLVVFGYQNSEILSEKTHFVFDLFLEGYRYETPEFPIVLLYGVFFLLGLLLAGFHGIYERFARKAEVRRRDKKIRALEKELGEVRSELGAIRPPEGGVTARAEDGAGPDTAARTQQLEAPATPAREETPTL